MSFVNEENKYFAPFKKHECILNNKNESFENKVKSLIDVWNSVGELNLSQFDIRHVIQIMDWAKLHALNIVLTAEWNGFKATHQAKLLSEIEKAQNELLKLNSGFATRCKKLADVVNNPWEDPVLMNLMKTKDAEIGPAEIEFFCVETAYLISVRLKKLCESQCEDLALNLVTAFMNCNKLSKIQNFNLNATETQMWFIFDIYIALLYKFQEKQKIVILLKELSFEEGIHLVKRFAKKRVKISKIWKNCHRVAVLATQMYISQAVVKYTDDLKEIVENYIEAYISLCNTESLLQDFTTSIRRISNLADAAGLYIFCDVIQRKSGTALKPFIIEMYIRALTTDMNELERAKDGNDQERAAIITSRLAGAFCTMADFLGEHVKVARECVLTAFSLEPTKERLLSIESVARKSGYQVLDTGQEWKCKLHPPVLPSDDVAWTCPECGDWMCKPQLNIPFKNNMALNEALQTSVLGISEALCDDLVVCLSNPRYQILSWFLPWNDLHRLCIMYLQDPQSTKNFVTELKFVDIDYSIFKGIKREPLDDLAGIEKGYEQYLDHDFVSDEETSSVSEDSMSQDSRPYSLGSDGAGDGPYLPLPQPKSDPNTLKSLRMFRPTLKRTRTDENISKVPEKIPKAGPSVGLNAKDLSKGAVAKPSLSTYLNGITSSVPAISTNTKESHSKNVKAATLPPLGGQVAIKELRPVQVLLQPLKSCQVPKNQADQALKPINQTDGTITEATKKELIHKLLNKPSLSGSKENNSHKLPVNNNSSSPVMCPPTLKAKIFVKTPSKINKQPKTQTVHNRISEIKPTIHPNLEISLIASTPSLNLTQPQAKSINQNYYPGINNQQPIHMDQLGKVFKKEHTNEIVSPKTDTPQTLEKPQVMPPVWDSNKAQMPSNLSSMSLNSEKTLREIDQTKIKTLFSMDGVQSPNLEKTVVEKISNKTLEKVSRGRFKPIGHNNGISQVEKTSAAFSSKNIWKNQLCCQDKISSEPVSRKNPKTLGRLVVCMEKVKPPTWQTTQAPTNGKITPISPEKTQASIPQTLEIQESPQLAVTQKLERNQIKTNVPESRTSPKIETAEIVQENLENKRPPNTDKSCAPLSSTSGSSSCCNIKNYSEHLTSVSPLLEHKENIENQMDSKDEEKHDTSVTSDNECELDKLDVKCNNAKSGNDVQNKGNYLNREPVVENRTTPRNSLGIIDNGIFSDLADAKGEDVFFQKNNYSSVDTELNLFDSHLGEELPKNFNLNGNIRTYTKKITKKQPVINKDCVKMPTGGDKLDVCKNVNSSCIQKPHSNVQMPQTNYRELKVVLCRLPNTLMINGRTVKLAESNSIRKKCDRGKTPPKSVRRRKSMDKSENKIDKAPSRVQNHKLSPLQDINPRVPPKRNSKSCCDDITKPKNACRDFMTPRVLLERIEVDNQNKNNYARSVLANIPGLNDYQMIRPTNVNHIVNVVQVSGGRQTQSMPIQNTQTSTQVSPHIQRIGQPRVADEKPENANSIASATSNSTITTTKTTTSQSSTLINILSQQIIRPPTTQINTPGRRQAPVINILSQQTIRPPQTHKSAAHTNITTIENNQVKPVVAAEQPLNSQVNSQVNNSVKNTTAAIKTAIPATTGQGSTILQFICKSSLPKFQQAFGKTVYQNNTETSTAATTTIETTNITGDAKKTITKTVPVNVQPIQGSVIYSRQVPVGQTISLIPPGGTTRQVFRIATSNPEQLSLVKDSVIHSKMSALLAAALQARPKSSEGDQVNNEEKVTLTRPTLVQSARIVKPVQLQIPPSVVRTTTPQTNLSSTTLEQLREFDMVYKQVKERSSSTVPAESSNGPPENQEVPQQRISVTYVNQLPKYTQLSPVVVVSTYNNLQPAASPALSVTSQGSSSPCVTPAPTPTLPKIATKSSKGKTLKSTTNNTAAKSSPIPKPQQKPQEDEHTTQRIFDILAEYAEQLRNSPDLNNKPAPRRRSNPPTNPSQNSKRKKNSSASKKTGNSSNAVDIDADDITVGSEDSSGGGIMQLSVTDDEQSQAASTNTPESTENSNPSNPRSLTLTEGSTCTNQSRNLIIADSSVGEALKMPNTAVIVPGSYIMPVSMVKGGQQIAVVSGGSKILATVPARSGQNMLLFQSFMNQNRKGAISAVKYSTIQPISGISSQSLAGVSAQPPVILPSNSVAAAVALGQPLTLKKLNDDRDSNELLLTISHPKRDINKNPIDLPQPDSSTSVSSDSNDIKIEENTLQSDNNSNEKIFHTYQKSVITNSMATSVIATTSASCIKEGGENHSQNVININITSDNIKGEPKPVERLQSVLVTACSSNGPMLSHTTPRYRKPVDANRTNNNELPNKGFLHNGEKISNNEQKPFRTGTAYYVNRARKNVSELHKADSEMQKQAAIERELRLQKSLSEECEDLGVDEPSTSDLFPEADLLFDANHSPSFDQSSQDIIKRLPQAHEIKEEVKAAMSLFSDDENSSSLRTDLFEYVEFQTVETALDYQAQQLINGNTTSNESLGCEDNTLLAKCPTMSEVTLNSPISPEMYTETSLNKYKFKYSNRKKEGRVKQNDFQEVVSSSEDTVGSTELGRINCEDDNFKLVHVAITKSDIVKEEDKCELHCDEDLDSPSGRGARRSVRKLCSCCNGSQDGSILRKRPHSSRPHTPAAPHKKAFLNKKR